MIICVICQLPKIKAPKVHHRTPSPINNTFLTSLATDRFRSSGSHSQAGLSIWPLVLFSCTAGCHPWRHFTSPLRECFGHSFSSGTLSRFSHTFRPIWECFRQFFLFWNTLMPFSHRHTPVWECFRYSFLSGTLSHHHDACYADTFGINQRGFSRLSCSVLALVQN